MADKPSCWNRAGGRFAARPARPLRLDAIDGYFESLRQRQIDAKRREREEYWRSRDIQAARDTIELARIELGIDEQDASPQRAEVKDREIDTYWRTRIGEAQETLKTLLGGTGQ